MLLLGMPGSMKEKVREDMYKTTLRKRFSRSLALRQLPITPDPINEA